MAALVVALSASAQVTITFRNGQSPSATYAGVHDVVLVGDDLRPSRSTAPPPAAAPSPEAPARSRSPSTPPAGRWCRAGFHLPRRTSASPFRTTPPAAARAFTAVITRWRRCALGSTSSPPRAHLP